MREGYKAVILLGAIWCCFGKAKGQTESKEKDITIHYPVLIMNASVESGSNGLNQYFTNRLVFGGYISPEKMKKAESRVKTNARGGFYTEAQIKYFLPATWVKSKSDSQAIRINNFISLQQTQIGGARFSQDGFRLVFRGNLPYLGEKLDLGKTRVKYWNTRTVQFGSHLIPSLSGKKIATGLNIGLSQLLSYSEANVSKASVYTDPDLQYADVQWNGFWQNTGSNNIVGKGAGLVAGAVFQKIKGFRAIPIYFGVENIGVYYVGNLNKYQRNIDSVVRVNQVNITSKSLNSSDWLQFQKDTLRSALAPDTSKISKWMLSPFRIFANYRMHGMDVVLDYRHISGFIPRAVISPIKSWNLLRRLYVKPSLQLGGFDTYNLNVSMEYIRIKKGSNIMLAVYLFGIEGMVLPQYEHGSGAGFRLHILSN